MAKSKRDKGSPCDFDKIVKKVLDEHFPRIEQLTSQQKEALEAIFLRKQDTFAILPTGHGKSLIFEMAPFVSREIGVFDSHFSQKDVVIVISPLIAIMELHISILRAAGFAVCGLH